MGRKQTNIGEVQRNNTAEYVVSSNYVIQKDTFNNPNSIFEVPAIARAF
jgi:hypothetical protein